MLSFLSSLLTLVFLTFSQADRIIPIKDPNNPIVTFGSCNKSYKNPNPEIFQKILEQSPDLWMWVGDVAYLYKHQQDYGDIIASNFTQVKNSPHYKKLRTNTAVIGTWDDHDYGDNDGDKTYKHKERNKQIYLDFLDEPLDSPRRTRDGLYESYYLGEDKRVKIILLDIRYNKDGRFSLGYDMLGENQWAWLEEEIKNDKADFTLIASGSQVLPDDRIFPEHWYVESKERLFGLIRKYKLGGVLLLSGDVHYTEIMKHPCPQRVGYNLYEFTSSGLTHFISDYIPYGGQLFNELFPHTFNGPADRYMEKNFGTIRFLFNESEPKMVLEARNDHGTKVLEKVIPKSELEYKEEIINMNVTCVLDQNRYYRLLWKYGSEILRKNRFLITYTVVVGLICLGFVCVVGVVMIKRKMLFGMAKGLCKKIWKSKGKIKQT